MPCNTNTTSHHPHHHSQQNHHVTPQAFTTITAHPPQLQRGEGTQKTHRRSPPGQKGGRKVAGEKTLHPRGRGATMTCMHVAHAVVGPIEKAVFGWGAESGVQIGEGVGLYLRRERGRRSRTTPWWRKGRGRARVSSVNLGGTFSLPMGGGVGGFPNKGVISVVLRSRSKVVGRYMARHPGTTAAAFYSKSL